MKQQVEVERQILGRIVHSDVLMELLLAQDESVADPKRVVPHGPRELTVTQREDGFDVAGVEAVRTLLQLPPTDPSEPVLRTEVGRTEDRENKGNPAPDRLFAVEHGPFTHEELLLVVDAPGYNGATV